MKKMLAAVLTLCLLCVMIAFAENVENTKLTNDNSTANTMLKYSISQDQSFVVTIPANVTLSKSDDVLTGTMVISISAPDFNDQGSAIKVSLSSANFNLTKEGSNAAIGYSIKNGGKTVDLNDNSEIVRWQYGNDTNTATLSITADAPTSPMPYGDYTDTLTFTASLISAN